jgi:hypothetical protein
MMEFYIAIAIIIVLGIGIAWCIGGTLPTHEHDWWIGP